MSAYPQIETMMRNVLEREQVGLASDERRVASLEDELAAMTRACNAKREAIAEMERWLQDFGSK